MAKLDSIYIENTEKQITKAGYDNCSATMMPPGAVLFSSRAPIGHTAVTKIPICTNQGFKSFVPKNEVDSLYLFFCLKRFTPHIQSLGRGATFAEISKELIGSVQIPLPPLPVQKKIAAILEKADQARRKRQQVNRLTEQFLQSAFLEMFGDPIKNPKGWAVKKLGRSIKLKSGEFLPAKSMITDGPYAVYGGNGINGYHSSYLFEESKVVIGRVGMNCGSVLISKPRSWITDNALYVSEKVDALDNIFLAFMLRQFNLNKLAHRAAQPLLTGQLLYSLNLYLPPFSEQQKFAAIGEKVEAFREKQRQSKEELESIFQSLIQRAFTGELVV